MSALEPKYTAENCRFAYQLNWSLALFWKQSALPEAEWLAPLKDAIEPDGARVLEHRLTKENVSQFLLSTQPHLSPAAGIRAIKGRLQYLVRRQRPKAFRRNYSIHSVGSANFDAIERYVASQFHHHKMADPSVQERLHRHQFADPSVDLSEVRRSSYGEFVFNVQVVLVNRQRGVDVNESSLQNTYASMQRIARKKNQLLARTSVVADHIHLTLGCNVVEAPSDVALGYMNNLAFVHGMKALFQYGSYVGTFGRYDLQAIRRSLAEPSSLAPGQARRRRAKQGGRRSS